MPNLNKFNAYKNVAYDFDNAVEIINSKKLVFGEPAFVPFYYPNSDSSVRVVKGALGIGNLDGSAYIIGGEAEDVIKLIDDVSTYFSERLDEMSDDFYPVADQEYTEQFDGNMNALLDTGVYKTCYIGRPNPSEVQEYYTLRVTDAGVATEDSFGSGVEIKDRINYWLDRGETRQKFLDEMTKTGTYTIDNLVYNEYYDTYSGADLNFTHFKTKLPVGTYEIYIKAYPSYTPGRGVEGPLTVPSIKVLYRDGGDESSSHLINTGHSISEYTRLNLSSNSKFSYITLYVDTDEEGNAEFSLISENSGYNWFVYDVAITGMYIDTTKYHVINQMCMSHLTGDIYKRVIYSSEMDLDPKERTYAPPATVYPEYNAFDNDPKMSIIGISSWDKVASIKDIKTINDTFGVDLFDTVTNADASTFRFNIVFSRPNENIGTVSDVTIPCAVPCDGSVGIIKGSAGLMTALDKYKLERVYEVLGILPDEDDVIDKFNEIKDFLDGILEETTLIELLNNLKDSVNITSFTSSQIYDKVEINIGISPDDSSIHRNLSVFISEPKAEDGYEYQGFNSSALSNPGGAMTSELANYMMDIMGITVQTVLYQLVQKIASFGSQFGSDRLLVKGERISNILIDLSDHNQFIIKNKDIYKQMMVLLTDSNSQLNYNFYYINPLESKSFIKNDLIPYTSIFIFTDYNTRFNDASVLIGNCECAGVIKYEDKVKYDHSVNTLWFDSSNDNMEQKIRIDVSNNINEGTYFEIPTATLNYAGAMSSEDRRSMNAIVESLGDIMSGYELLIDLAEAVYRNVGTDINCDFIYNKDFEIEDVEFNNHTITSSIATPEYDEETDKYISHNVLYAQQFLNDADLHIHAIMYNLVHVNKTKTIKVVDPIYYGFSETNVNEITYYDSVPRYTYTGKYISTSNSDGYFYICIPVSMVGEDAPELDAIVGDVTVPLDLVTNEEKEGYHIYKIGGNEGHLYEAGTNIKITIL